MGNSILEKIGAQVAHNLADHFENVIIPTIDVCIYELQKIKQQLEQMKKVKEKTEHD